MSALYDYSDKRTTSSHEYRIVTARRNTIDRFKKDNPDVYDKYMARDLLDESEWRSLKICMSPGWEHIGYVYESLAFKKPIKCASMSSTRVTIEEDGNIVTDNEPEDNEQEHDNNPDDKSDERPKKKDTKSDHGNIFDDPDEKTDEKPKTKGTSKSDEKPKTKGTSKSDEKPKTKGTSKSDEKPKTKGTSKSDDPDDKPESAEHTGASGSQLSLVSTDLYSKSYRLAINLPVETYHERYAYLRCMCNVYHIQYPFVNHPDLNDRMFTILFDWLLEVCVKFKNTYAAYSLAAYVLYLFMSKSRDINRKDLQLYGLAALDLAIKVEEDEGTTEIGDWVYISDNAYTESQVIASQKAIMQTLKCNVILPSVERILCTFIQEYHITCAKQTALMRYLSNLATVELIFPKYPSYVVAEVCFVQATKFTDFVPQYYDKFTACYKDLKLASETIHDKKYKSVLTCYNVRRGKLQQPSMSCEITDHTIVESDTLTTRVEKYNQLMQEQLELYQKPDTIHTELVTDVSSYWKVGTLGEGTYGDVHMVNKSDADGKLTKYAAKYYKQEYILANGIEQSIVNELSVMTSIKHPNIMSLHEIYIPAADDAKMIAYMDVMTSFNEYIQGRRLKIKQVKNFIKQILTGLEHLHKFDIMHRDLKPQNILIEGGILKIMDFGNSFWAHQSAASRYSANVCTMWYAPPELLLDKYYNKTIDIWSAGIILLEMVIGDHIFVGDNKNEQLFYVTAPCSIDDLVTVRHIPSNYMDLHKNYTCDNILLILKDRPNRWNNHPVDLDNLVDLAIRMLAIDPNYRCTATQALEHPFLKDT